MAFGDGGFGDGPAVGQRGRGSNNNRGGNNNNRKKKNNNNNRNGGGGGGGGGGVLVDDPFDTSDIGGGLFGQPLPTTSTTAGPRGTGGAGGLELPTTFTPGNAGGTGINPDPFTTPAPGPRGSSGDTGIFTPPTAAGGTLPPPVPVGVDTSGLGSAVTPGNVGGEPGGPGSIFTPTGEDASGDTENYRNVAWGLLNQAGIANDPFFGGNATDWLDQQIEDWYTQYEGLGQLAGADRQPWNQFLYGLPGVPPPATAPDLTWITQHWAPAMRAGLAARFYAQTPRNRGYDSTRYRAPGRVITY